MRTKFLESRWHGRRWRAWRLPHNDRWNNLTTFIAAQMNAVNEEVWMEVTP